MSPHPPDRVEIAPPIVPSSTVTMETEVPEMPRRYESPESLWVGSGREPTSAASRRLAWVDRVRKTLATRLETINVARTRGEGAGWARLTFHSARMRMRMRMTASPPRRWPR
jgi:hypothetical protein